MAVIFGTRAFRRVDFSLGLHGRRLGKSMQKRTNLTFRIIGWPKFLKMRVIKNGKSLP